MEPNSTQNYLFRILGYDATDDVTDAMAALHLSRNHGTPLVIMGDEDEVPIALALHRRELDPASPFVLSDRRRAETTATVRSVTNQPDPSVALDMARGGSLCLRARRPPSNLREITKAAKRSGVLFFVCGDMPGAGDSLLSLTSPIRLPPLSTRKDEIERVVQEYAIDASIAMGVSQDFYIDDLAWVIENSAKSLHEIYKGTHRLAALRAAGSIPGAAALLGMAPVSLRRWLGRRGTAPVRVREEPAPKRAKRSRPVRLHVGEEAA